MPAPQTAELRLQPARQLEDALDTHEHELMEILLAVR